MATTESGIWTPDSDDDYNPVIDLASMADSIESLLGPLLLGDTGWVSVTPQNSNWSRGSRYSYRGLSVRKVGKIAYLEGSLENVGQTLDSGVTYTGARLPEGFNPSTRVPLLQVTLANAEVSVLSTGEISIVPRTTLPAGTVYVLSGNWVVDD